MRINPFRIIRVKTKTPGCRAWDLEGPSGQLRIMFNSKSASMSWGRFNFTAPDERVRGICLGPITLMYIQPF